MILHEVKVKIKHLDKTVAQKKADLAAEIANNIQDIKALEILAKKSKKTGVDKKIIKYQHIL